MLDFESHLLWSIAEAAQATGESIWSVKQRLRAGIYRAKKSGKRTLVVPESVKEYAAGLPDATFAPLPKTPLDPQKAKRAYRRRMKAA